MRAIGRREYFESIANGGYGRDDFREGTKLVHRWIQLLFGGATAEWATRVFAELDATMERDHHDGAHGWGVFRNDVTAWLGTWVRDRGTPADRTCLVDVAARTERYLRALGSGHAPVTAPLAARWRDVLERGDAAGLAALVEEARATHEMHTVGAGGVLFLMEASARVVDGAALSISTDVRPGPAARSGRPLALPLEVCVWPSAGGEQRMQLADAPIAIGRADDAHVRVPSAMVARGHARIVHDGDALVLEDRDSENGTAIFEQRVRRATLEDGDVIVLGGTELLVVSAGAATRR